jgi:hypothetical protein
MDKDSVPLELIKRFPKESYEKALLSWRWLVPDEAVPLVASSFGDIFFAFRGMIFYLDLVNGTFDLIAKTVDELDKILTSKSGQENLLMATLSFAKQKSGSKLGAMDVFDFKVTPKLGGELSLENIQFMEFISTVHVAGQIHQQIKDLPPGTKITDVNIINKGSDR